MPKNPAALNNLTETPDKLPDSVEAPLSSIEKGTNLLALALTTSAAVVAIQNPFEKLIALLMLKEPIPTSLKFSSLLRAFYAGSIASIAASCSRAAVATGAKRNSLEKENAGPAINENTSSARNISFVAAFSAADVTVSQVPVALSFFKKLNYKFNWRSPGNFYKLATVGIMPRYLSSLVGCYSLCVIEKRVTPFISSSDGAYAHVLGGAISGIGAGLVTYPLGMYVDTLMLKTTLQQGQLKVPTTLQMISAATIVVKDRSLSDTLKMIGRDFAVQAPLRATKTGLVFGIVCGTSKVFGTTPVTDVLTTMRRGTFFNHNLHQMNASSEKDYPLDPGSEFLEPSFRRS